MRDKNPKRQARLIGIDDAPFDKFKSRKTFLVGTIYRGGDFMDGLVSTDVIVDGTDATRKMIAMINHSKFKPQLQCILLKGIAVGGFNVIDVKELSEKTKLSVLIVVRDYPNFNKIFSALRKLGMEEKIRLIQQAGELHKVGKIWVQLTNLSLEKAKKILEIACTHSHIPEPIRIAHIIAAGIAKGESRGKA